MTARGKKASQRQQRREAARAAARRKRILIWSGLAAALIAVIGFFALRPLPEELAGVETFSDQGRGHLAQGETPPEYNSQPATSGAHSPTAAQCGIYTTGIPDAVQVHNLEHGAVVVQYRPDLPIEEIEALQDYARTKRSHILLAPRADLDDPVVVTSWRRMLRLDSADIETIDVYFDQFVFKGPEVGVPCPFAIDQAA